MRALAVTSVLFAAGLAGAAQAHAFLQEAAPRVGAQVSRAPPQIRLRYSEPVEAALSRITVSGPAGFAGAGAAQAAGSDRAVLLAPLPRSMPPGRYLVQWRVISADSHATQGQFRFEIGP